MSPAPNLADLALAVDEALTLAHQAVTCYADDPDRNYVLEAVVSDLAQAAEHLECLKARR